MKDLLEMLTGSLGGDAQREIAKKIGGDQEKTETATAAAVSTLIGALSRNASRGDGAEKLLGALQRDHDGGVLDNLRGVLDSAGGNDGEAILGHVLGGRRPAVQKGLSKTTGLDEGAVGKLLATLAPVVLGALGKAQREQNLDASSLAGFLGRQREQIETREPAVSGIMGQLLDSDGDGDVDVSDIARKGMSVLGKFFKK